ncbi:MAG: hypothetical protein HN544_07760 [Euryarchaeota archaeon]|nr:hypothetical protein [Euryarchaeota archaeon]
MMWLDKKYLKAIAAIIIISLPSLVITGNYIISDSPAPTDKDAVEPNPFPDEPLTEGLLFVVIDGGRRAEMSDPDVMPNLNRRVANGAYLEVETNPMTMTAICVKEIATGVPSRPNEALQNFHPTHPGTPDGWNLASTHDADGDGEYDHMVGIVGDYVWRDLYPDRELIPFAKHRYGHADYYQGDEEAFVTLQNWVDGKAPSGYENAPNVIITHISGTDSVGHRYGVGPEYIEKLGMVDDSLEQIFQSIPNSWTVVVTSDHGLTDSGQHGSPEQIIRDTAAFMWGPGIKKGVVVEGVVQRDLATIPSMLLSLPFPHAIHGKIPLDAFDIEGKEAVYEQWNWDAAVARNSWMEDNGHSYVEDLSTDVIEWDELPGDEIGIRDIDILLTAMATIAIGLALYRILKDEDRNPKMLIMDLVTIQLLFVSSALLAYNRENATGVYYTLGLFIPLALFAISYYTAKSEDINENHFKKLGYIYVVLAVSLVFYQYKLALLALVLFGIAYYITKSDYLDEKKRNASQTCVATMMAFMLIYVETRFTILSLGILMLFLLDKKTYVRESEMERTPKRILYPLLAVLFTTVFFSDYRIYGFSANRQMIFWTLSYEPELVLFSSIIAFAFTLLYSLRNEDVPFIYGLPIAAVMATIPVLISQSSDTVDWIMLSILCVGVAMSVYNYFVNKKLGIMIFQYCAFAWLIMSWGAWAGAASMLFFGATESILEKEWKFLKLDNNDTYSELSRITILTILPIGMWFAWWATMGQTDGLAHTRDIDPGNLILRGGYIGDRISPSNEWVGFMGAGPVILVGILFWNIFRMNGWPIHFAFLALLIRAAFLSLQLSITPDFPRILFKISWDLFFCLIIAGTILFYMLYDKWLVQNVPEQSSGM